MQEQEKRQTIGSFIYPYVTMVVKQLQPRLSATQATQVTAKTTGMVISIPSFAALVNTVATFDVLAMKTREALAILEEAYRA